MNYSKRILVLEILPENLEWAAGILIAEDIQTWEEISRRDRLELRAALPKGLRGKSLLRGLEQGERNLGCRIFLRKKIQTLKDFTWEKKYLQGLKPFTLPAPKTSKTPTKKRSPILIDPSGRKNPDENTLSLTAGMAFGTGTHPSTRLAALALQESIQERGAGELLDVGTGSGILAMVGRLLGVKHIWVVENDLEALKVAGRNFKKNRIGSIQSRENLTEVQRKFQVVTANILATVLTELKSKILARTRVGGDIILSGLTYREIPAMRKVYHECRLVRRYNLKGWSALRLRKTKA